MKKTLLILCSFISVSAFADPGKDAAYQACARITSSSENTRCISAVAQGSYFDPRAVKACDRFKEATPTVSCLIAIRDMAYDSDVAIKACDDNQTVEGTVACFRAVGRPIYSSDCQGSAIRHILDSALSALSNQQYARANSLVIRARDLTLSCQN